VSRAGGALLVATAWAVQAAVAAATPVQVPDTLAQRLQPCTACHGAQGRSVDGAYVPRLAGKPAGYLFEQLLNFRDGRRHNATMAGFLADLPDAYLREMATHFAALDLPYEPAAPRRASPEALARGERLARRGDATRDLPACTACHGEAMTGAQPAMPGLLGLPRDYLIGQLGAWRNGTRRATAPDCMAEIAKRLSVEDLGAVADWLAAQPVPSPMRADAAPTQPAPLRCGSARHAR